MARPLYIIFISVYIQSLFYHIFWKKHTRKSIFAKGMAHRGAGKETATAWEGSGVGCFFAGVANQISLMKWINIFKSVGLKFAIRGNFTLDFRPFHK
jgi:hypothetical protein